MLTFIESLSTFILMSTVAKLASRTLREHATVQIRQFIVSGTLPPGKHVVEVRLSEELQVSRSTLRESLRALEVEGLLVSDGRGHLSVRTVNSRQILEVYEVRAAIELLAVRRLARLPEGAFVAAGLRRVLAPLKDLDLDFASQIEVDMAFHERMCQLTGNQTLLESWRRLIGQLEMVIIAAGPIRAPDRMRYDEHELIVAAIETGDPDHAEAVLRDHLNAFGGAYAADALEREADSP